MKFEPMDFYRIVSTDKEKLFLYDREFREGLYFNSNKEIDEDLTELGQLEMSSRDSRLKKLSDIGRQVDELILVREFSSIREDNSI
jgi:hypothetical protein